MTDSDARTFALQVVGESACAHLGTVIHETVNLQSTWHLLKNALPPSVQTVDMERLSSCVLYFTVQFFPVFVCQPSGT